MIQRHVGFIAASVFALFLLPVMAFAQEGSIAGVVRDSSEAVLPGVVIEVKSPALIERVRTTTTDGSGQYRITNLPVGTYTVTFSLEGFSTLERDGIAVSSGFTANVSPSLTVGTRDERVVVQAASPTVDVQNARQAITFTGELLKELPTARNINSLLELTPGISSNYRVGQAFGQPGVCNGGVGVFCNPGVQGFNVGDTGQGFLVAGADPLNLGNTNIAQGRIMIDGQVINGTSGANAFIGQTSGITADIGSAQEVNVQLSGALGESETGGASINIIPRTGGNRFAGDYNTTFTQAGWFDRNNGNYANIAATTQLVRSDYDVSGDFGGPIKRDRLWFFTQARAQGIHKLPVGVDFWPNLNEGKFGYNYQPDRSKPRVEYRNMWRNISERLTYQATQRDKFNVYWDEQDFCQDPCLGVVSVATSPESWWSLQARPNRLQQLSWTNPFTSRLLLEGGFSISAQHYDTTHHREYRNPREIPRVSELGDTAGMDSTASRVNQFAGGGAFPLSSGSLNSQMGAGGAELRNLDNYRTRAASRT